MVYGVGSDRVAVHVAGVRRGSTLYLMIGGPPRGELNLQPQTMEAKQNTTEPQTVTKDDLVMRSVNFSFEITLCLFCS